MSHNKDVRHFYVHKINYFIAITSISTNALLGNSLTATAERAGKAPENWVGIYSSYQQKETIGKKNQLSLQYYQTHNQLLPIRL